MKTMLKLFNTLSRKKESFKPLKKGGVGLYTCGPTVYWYAHIGNLRTYVFEDVLKKVLEYNGYGIKHIMNITDVGHLTSDADTGEDKLEKGARREKKTVWEIADFYTNAFKNDLKRLNIKPPDVWVKATATIKDQLALIQVLEKRGFTYKIADGIYFDTSKLRTYGRLWGSKKRKGVRPPKIKAGARKEMAAGKKNPADFALWKFSPRDSKRQMEWGSPWGVGFPGWHTECVVMGIKNLGVPFDIHCGGIDHIPIHHTNEIAQAEAAYGKILANFWLHGEFLSVEDEKMAKSEGNIFTLEDLGKKGFSPLAYRYFCLGALYRSKLNFSWEALEGAQNALNNLYNIISNFRDLPPKTGASSPCLLASRKTQNSSEYKRQFLKFINDDLNMPKALALMWQLVKDEKIAAQEKYKLLLEFDKIFGLNLSKIKKLKIPQEIKELAELREKHRRQKDWQKADELRQKIKKLGYLVEDTVSGPFLRPQF